MQTMQAKVNGYSLIELIVALAIMAIAAVAATQLLISSLLGASKADALAELKENGDSAMLALERTLRQGAEITSTTCDPNNPINSITFETYNGDEYTIAENNERIEVISPADSRFITNQNVEVDQFDIYCADEVTYQDKVRVEITMILNRGERAADEVSSVFRTAVMMRNKR